MRSYYSFPKFFPYSLLLSIDFEWCVYFLQGPSTPSRGVTTPTTTTTTTSCLPNTNSTMVAGGSTNINNHQHLTVTAAVAGGVTTSPMLVRSVSGVVPSTTPVIQQQHELLTLHPPASPYQWAAQASTLHRPTRAHSDNFYSSSLPQPLAVSGHPLVMVLY